MKNVFVGILILIALILIGGYYMITREARTEIAARNATLPTGSPKPSNTIDTAPLDWETYTSEVYGFTIRYPQDIQQETTSEGERFSKVGSTQSTGTELYDGISLMIVSGSRDEKDFKAFIDETYALIKNDATQPRVGELQEVTIAGKDGYQFSVSSLGDREHIYLPKGDDEYIEIINGTVGPVGTKASYQKTVDMMLSTLVYE